MSLFLDMASFTVSGKLIDLFAEKIYPATVSISNGIITDIRETSEASDQYLLPGFIDAHVHIESSMMVPASFAQMAVVHGTVATVSDPHEIANVCGIAGVEYMLANAMQTPFKFFFGAPSCVPATSFETAGAHLDAKAVSQLLRKPDIWYLSEMMNYPGVLYNDGEVVAKLEAAKDAGKPIDGHAPGLRGQDAINYAAAGITTDHECFTLEEALDKIAAGMKIIIREGSAAKNYEALHPLLKLHPETVMFCSDDKHPDELVISHINALVKRSLQKGYDLFDVLRTACMYPVQHYQLPVGLLRVNDPADFIVINDTTPEFEVLQTYIGGTLVAENNKSLLPFQAPPVINNFKALPKLVSDFAVPAPGGTTNIRIIEAIEGQLVTNELHAVPKIEDGCIVSDVENDVLKIVVVNRYEENARPAAAFIKNFGLQYGALASTVGHDCHNIIAVGVNDAAICAAVNALITNKGGIAVAKNADEVECMPLPIAGLMSDADGYTAAKAYSKIDAAAKELGTKLKAPFMTLSFMALLVIPALKLSDQGLFNGKDFKFTDLVI